MLRTLPAISHASASCNNTLSPCFALSKVYIHSGSGLSSFLLMSVRFANRLCALPASSHALQTIANLIISRAHG